MNPRSTEELQKLSSQFVLTRSQKEGKKSYLLTYSRKGEGTTTVLSQLGVQLAKDSALSVLLIDGNLRSPSLHSLWNVPRSPGLAEACVSRNGLESGIRKTALPNLSLLPAGEDVHRPVDLFLGNGFKEVLTRLREGFDLLLFDSAPLTNYRDAVALGSQLDGAIMLVRAQFVAKSLVLRNKRQLRDSGIEVLGVILNGKKTPAPQYVMDRLRAYGDD